MSNKPNYLPIPDLMSNDANSRVQIDLSLSSTSIRTIDDGDSMQMVMDQDQDGHSSIEVD